MEDTPSECMRWPSLRRQALISQSESTPKEDGEKLGYCDLCKELGWQVYRKSTYLSFSQLFRVNCLQCNMELPCFRCNEVELPCSNCLLPIPDLTNHSSPPFHLDKPFSFVYNNEQKSTPKRWSSPFPPLSFPPPGNDTDGLGHKSDNKRNSLDRVYSALPVAPQRNSTSRAQSVTSARTSNSGGSTQSARYSIKLNRRISANNRPFSAIEIATPSNATDTLPRNHTRSISLHDALDKRKPQQSKRNSVRELPSSKTAGMQYSPTSMTAPKRASSSQKAVSARKNDGRDDYFYCLICGEIFESMLDVHVHERAFHSEKFCTFCGLAFGDRTNWHDHERNHMRAVYKECDNILWRCGVCSVYGVREPRRYMHIRGHWEDGNTVRDWKGGPQIMPLDPSVIEALESMTDDRFNLNAESFLTTFLRRSSVSIATAQNWVELNQISTEPKSSIQKMTKSSPKTTGHLEARAVDPAQQLVEHSQTSTEYEASNQQMTVSLLMAGNLEDRTVDTSQQMVEHNRSNAGPETSKQQVTGSSPKATCHLEDRAIDTSRQMTHGLFASLRRRMPLFRARPP